MVSRCGFETCYTFCWCLLSTRLVFVSQILGSLLTNRPECIVRMKSNNCLRNLAETWGQNSDPDHNDFCLTFLHYLYIRLKRYCLYEQLFPGVNNEWCQHNCDRMFISYVWSFIYICSLIISLDYHTYVKGEGHLCLFSIAGNLSYIFNTYLSYPSWWWH